MRSIEDISKQKHIDWFPSIIRISENVDVLTAERDDVTLNRVLLIFVEVLIISMCHSNQLLGSVWRRCVRGCWETSVWRCLEVQLQFLSVLFFFFFFPFCFWGSRFKNWSQIIKMKSDLFSMFWRFGTEKWGQSASDGTNRHHSLCKCAHTLYPEHTHIHTHWIVVVGGLVVFAGDTSTRHSVLHGKRLSTCFHDFISIKSNCSPAGFLFF